MTVIYTLMNCGIRG